MQPLNWCSRRNRILASDFNLVNVVNEVAFVVCIQFFSHLSMAVFGEKSIIE